MKKKTKIYLSTVFIFLLYFMIAQFSLAYDYTPMENIPGFEGICDNINATQCFPLYVSSIYKFGLWAIGIASLLMLSIGGFMYFTSAGNTSHLEKAKTIIRDSILGIIAVMTAWLLLYVINPDLVGGNLESLKAARAPSAVSPPSEEVKGLAEQVKNHGGIGLYSSGDCKDAENATVSPQTNINELINGSSMIVCNSTCKSAGTFCTGQTNMSEYLLQVMINVADSAGSYHVTSIAGGQHSMNSDHYKGLAIDIRPGAPQDQWSDYIDEFHKNVIDAFCDKGGKKVDCSVADHIHASFGSGVW